MTQEIQTTANVMNKANVSVGFFSLESFELTQRMAKLLSTSDLVPQNFRGNISNCSIALNMAARIDADPLMVMQNLYVVHGRLGSSSQWVIASVNQCGRFSTLKYKMYDKGEIIFQGKTLQNMACVAYAISHDTGETVESPEVSIQMAIDERWYEKNGSKWKTMPELMLRYRAATFFGRLYAPELLMGFRTIEEEEDIQFVETLETGEVVESTVKVPKGKMKKAEAVAEPEPIEAAKPEQEPEATTVQVDDQTIDTDTGEVLQAAEDYPLNPDDATDDDFFAGTN